MASRTEFGRTYALVRREDKNVEMEPLPLIGGWVKSDDFFELDKALVRIAHITEGLLDDCDGPRARKGEIRKHVVQQLLLIRQQCVKIDLRIWSGGTDGD